MHNLHFREREDIIRTESSKKTEISKNIEER